MAEFDQDKVVGIYIQQDWETPERAGASGSFQIISVTLTMDDDTTLDITDHFDQGNFYESQEQVIRSLGLDPEAIDLESADEY